MYSARKTFEYNVHENKSAICFPNHISRQNAKIEKHRGERRESNVFTDSDFLGKMSPDADSDGSARVGLERSASAQWGCDRVRLRADFGIFPVMGDNDGVR